VTEIPGAAWHADPHELVPASRGSLAPKILCDRHKPVLSPLDCQASRLIEELLRFDHALRDAHRL
jgi:hypothetical protein